MADQKLHFIITSESGGTRSLAVGKRTLRNCVVGGVILSLLSIAATAAALRFFHTNTKLSQDVAVLSQQLKASGTAPGGDSDENALALQRRLRKSQAELLAVRREKNRLVNEYQTEIANLMKEQETIIQSSISRLDERARVIETVMDTIGIQVKVEPDPDHSGGPFISMDPLVGDSLMQETDRYLNLIEKMPLGRPVPGAISSGFGRRKDPLNTRTAFHAGIDFRGDVGDPVKATGSGVVRTSSYNAGLGHYVVVRHVHGFETLYAHLSKRLVKRGDKISRNHTIGLVGNSGRSTGSHLHYEVRRGGKPINPNKLIKVAGLSLSVHP